MVIAGVQVNNFGLQLAGIFIAMVPLVRMWLAVASEEIKRQEVVE